MGLRIGPWEGQFCVQIWGTIYGVCDVVWPVSKLLWTILFSFTQVSELNLSGPFLLLELRGTI